MELCDTNSGSRPKSAMCFSISRRTSGRFMPRRCASRVSTSSTFCERETMRTMRLRRHVSYRTFSKPRLMSSSRGIQTFSDEESALKETSYSYDCLSFLRLMISSMIRFWPSKTKMAPSFILSFSSSVRTRLAFIMSSMSSPVWYRQSMYSSGVLSRCWSI